MLRPILRSALRFDRICRVIAAAMLAALVIAFPLSSALAHAIVVRSDPPDSSVVAAAPHDIRLWFSEAISPKFTQAQVLNVKGEVVPSEARPDPNDPTLLVVTVPELSDGVYNVVYAALSAADGHATQGHLVFRVGAGTEAGAGSSSPAQPSVSIPESLLRWVDFVALAGVVGAIAVAILLLKPNPSLAESAPPVAAALLQARRRVLGWAFACAVAATALGAALLYWQATLFTLPGTASAGPGVAASVLSLLRDTRSGSLWLVRQCLLLVIAILLLAWRRRSSAAGAGRGDRTMGAVLSILGAAVLATQALSGHAAAIAPGSGAGAFVAPLMDVLHLIAASLWVGGLLALVVGLLPLALAKRDTPAFAALVHAGWRPFGALAALSVGVLIATGLYNAGTEVASLDVLLTTFYGRTLMVKVVLVLAVGAVGLLNASLLHPRLADPGARLFRRPEGWTPLSLERFPVLVLVEVTLGMLVLLATGLLTSTAPPHGPQFAPAPPPVQARTLAQQADDILVSFDAKPNLPGQNVITLGVANTRRPAPAEIMRVIVHFTYLGQKIGVVTTDAQKIAPTTYQVSGDQLSLAGPWQVQVAVRRKGLEDSVTQFQWNVAAPGPARASRLCRTSLGNRG